MGKVAFVTGGSGAVGHAIVRRLCQEDYATAFTYHTRSEAGLALARETGALALQADLTEPEQVERVVGSALEQFGRIDVLVNNAGVTQVLPFALIEPEDWDAVIAGNLKTMFLVTKSVVRNMIARKSGVVINLGSLAGQRLLEVPVHYATAKAAVSGFTRALARELARYNIRVNSVVPGLLDDGVGKMVPEKEKEEYLHFCVAGRPGKPEEVAEMIAFLAGDKAAYINAQDFFVDGGI